MISLSPGPGANPFDGVAHLLDKLANLSLSHRGEVASAINKGFQDNFDRESAGDTGLWARLRPMTISQRKKRGYGPSPILVQSGSYRDSFVKRFATDHRELFTTTANGWTLESGSQDDRVGILEFGGTNSTGRFVPARPVSFLSSAAENHIFDVLESITDKVIAQAI